MCIHRWSLSDKERWSRSRAAPKRGRRPAARRGSKRAGREWTEPAHTARLGSVRSPRSVDSPRSVRSLRAPRSVSSPRSVCTSPATTGRVIRLLWHHRRSLGRALVQLSALHRPLQALRTLGRQVPRKDHLTVGAGGGESAVSPGTLWGLNLLDDTYRKTADAHQQRGSILLARRARPAQAIRPPERAASATTSRRFRTSDSFEASSVLILGSPENTT